MKPPSFGKVSVAALCSIVLLCAGAVLVTPVANAVGSINWGSAWKHEIKPRADKVYVSKQQAAKQFAPMPKVIRGTFLLLQDAPAASSVVPTDISFGWTFPSAPTVHIINPGAPVPAGCRGSVANPGAKPGNLCIFERFSSNAAGVVTCSAVNVCGSEASPFGAWLAALSSGAGTVDVDGSWAAAPAGHVKAGRSLPSAQVRPGPAVR